jgi:hypothetical protein
VAYCGRKFFCFLLKTLCFCPARALQLDDFFGLFFQSCLLRYIEIVHVVVEASSQAKLLFDAALCVAHLAGVPSATSPSTSAAIVAFVVVVIVILLVLPPDLEDDDDAPRSGHVPL